MPDTQTGVNIYWTKEKSDFREDLAATMEIKRRTMSATRYTPREMANLERSDRIQGSGVEMVYNIEAPIDKTWLDWGIFCAANVNIQCSQSKLDDCLYIVPTGVLLCSPKIKTISYYLVSYIS